MVYDKINRLESGFKCESDTLSITQQVDYLHRFVSFPYF